MPDHSSNVIMVQADNVTIHDLTVDGYNPSLHGEAAYTNGTIRMPAMGSSRITTMGRAFSTI